MIDGYSAIARLPGHVCLVIRTGVGMVFRTIKAQRQNHVRRPENPVDRTQTQLSHRRMIA
jgi:hypothetical protein